VKQAPPAFPFYPRDFMSATSAWTLEERGAYICLLSLQWEVGHIPGDIKRLAVTLGVSAARARSLWKILEAKFPASPGDGLLRNDRLEFIRQEVHRRRLDLARRGQKGASTRYGRSYDTSHGGGDSSGDDNGYGVPTPSGSVVPSSSAGLRNGSGRGSDSPGGLSPAVLARLDETNFDAFWSSYPRKVGKLNARKAWKQTAKKRPPLADLLDRLRLLAKSLQWTRDEGQFIPHPATWLRRGGWEDEPEGTRSKPRGTGAEVDEQLAAWAAEGAK